MGYFSWQWRCLYAPWPAMSILDIPCYRHWCDCFCLNNPDQLFFNDYSNFENRWFAMFFGKSLKNMYFSADSKLKPESSECTFSLIMILLIAVSDWLLRNNIFYKWINCIVSTKMREVLGNPSTMPKRFPETWGMREISRADYVWSTIRTDDFAKFLRQLTITNDYFQWLLTINPMMRC